MQPDLTSYDVVVYPSYTHPQTHPDRLAVIGTLFGLKPADVQHCRVLELGCGDGSNLVPMASSLPESEFVGIDLATRAIAHGQQMVGELGLANVRLFRGSLTEIDSTWGTFDYIIAHGIFSWVEEGIRDRLLAICHDFLEPQGIAFVSYSALPGGHMRNLLREMMLFHVRGFDAPKERVDQAMALARFLVDAQQTRDEYRLWLKAELEEILDHEPGHLYHDELAEISKPFYFTQFVEQAAAHALQYVGEADYFEMFDHGLTESARQTLGRLGRNRILREQYLDFVKCRRFRQTLLCHSERELETEPQPKRVENLFISSQVRRTSGAGETKGGLISAYETPKGARCATDFELGKAALAVLEEYWPLPLAYSEVLRQALAPQSQAGVSRASDGDSSNRLASFLLELYGAGVVEFRTTLPATVREVSPRPSASPLARWQVRQGDFVTSQFHIAVKVEDEVGRCLLSSLDGTLDRTALLERVWMLLKSKNAVVVPDGDEALARSKVAEDLDKNLDKLARLGLLVR